MYAEYTHPLILLTTPVPGKYNMQLHSLGEMSCNLQLQKIEYKVVSFQKNGCL